LAETPDAREASPILNVAAASVPERAILSLLLFQITGYTFPLLEGQAVLDLARQGVMLGIAYENDPGIPFLDPLAAVHAGRRRSRAGWDKVAGAYKDSRCERPIVVKY
jgi:hypothetical protein